MHVYVDNTRGPGDRPVRPLPERDPRRRRPRCVAGRLTRFASRLTGRVGRWSAGGARTMASAVTPNLGSCSALIWILLAMSASSLLAGLVVLYVAYPHRGEEVPNAPWVGDAMRKGVNLLPTLDNQTDEQKYDARPREKQHH